MLLRIRPFPTSFRFSQEEKITAENLLLALTRCVLECVVFFLMHIYFSENFDSGRRRFLMIPHSTHISCYSSQFSSLDFKDSTRDAWLLRVSLKCGDKNKILIRWVDGGVGPIIEITTSMFTHPSNGRGGKFECLMGKSENLFFISSRYGYNDGSCSIALEFLFGGASSMPKSWVEGEAKAYIGT